LYYLDRNNRISRFNVSQVGNISGFGEDHNDELYVVTLGGSNSGRLQRIVALELEQNDDELCVPIKASNGKIAVICL